MKTEGTETSLHQSKKTLGDNKLERTKGASQTWSIASQTSAKSYSEQRNPFPSQAERGPHVCGPKTIGWHSKKKPACPKLCCHQRPIFGN